MYSYIIQMKNLPDTSTNLRALNDELMNNTDAPLKKVGFIKDKRFKAGKIQEPSQQKR